MNKDWNYAHMWDTIRRSLEESAIQGLKVTALNVLNGMILLEELEEQRRKEREERHRQELEAASKTREMQMMFDGEIEFYPDGRKEFCAKEERGEKNG